MKTSVSYDRNALVKALLRAHGIPEGGALALRPRCPSCDVCPLRKLCNPP